MELYLHYWEVILHEGQIQFESSTARPIRSESQHPNRDQHFRMFDTNNIRIRTGNEINGGEEYTRRRIIFMESLQTQAYKRLAEVQTKLKAPKSQKNTFGNYNYRSCEDILESVKPLLVEAQLVLTMEDDLVQRGDRYYIKATVTVSDYDGQVVDASTAFAREEETKKGMDGSQITGTASSYARKYALNGLFLIDDTKDADSNEHHSQTSSSSSKTTVKTNSAITATKQATAPSSPASAAPNDGVWADCEIPGCKNGIKPEKVELNKKYHDGHSVCFEHSTDKEVPWKSLHPAYQSEIDDEALADEVLIGMGAKEVA